MEALEKLVSVACTAALVAAWAMEQSMPVDVRMALIAMAAACSPRPSELMDKAKDAVRAVRMKYSKGKPSGKGGKGKGK